MREQFSGTGVALATPFLESGSIDFPALQRVINHTIENKVDYLVTMGTTGESVTLTYKEKLQVLDFTIKIVDGRIPLVAGFGGNNTKDVVNQIKEFHFRGINAILSVSPFYNKPTQEGIIEHYRAIAKAAPVPVILYNVPSRTAANITAESTLTLAQEKNIIGIKEAAGDFNQIMTIVKDRPDGFLVISGDDAITLPMISLGCDGVISVLANAFPFEFAQLVQQALAENYEKARDLHYKLQNMMTLQFKEGNPAGIKCALDILNICEPYVRMPLMKASPNLRAEILEEIEKIRVQLPQSIQ